MEKVTGSSVCRELWVAAGAEYLFYVLQLTSDVLTEGISMIIYEVKRPTFCHSEETVLGIVGHT